MVGITIHSSPTESLVVSRNVHFSTKISKKARNNPVDSKLYLNDNFSFLSPEAGGGGKKGGKKKGSSFQTVSALFRVREKLFLTLPSYFRNLFKSKGLLFTSV